LRLVCPPTPSSKNKKKKKRKIKKKKRVYCVSGDVSNCVAYENSERPVGTATAAFLYKPIKPGTIETRE